MKELGRDLRTIRLAQQRELEDVYRLTRIPIHRLQAIEEGTLVPEGRQPDTYARSFIRSYAKALGVDEGTMVDVLNKCASGTYAGEVLKFAPADGSVTKRTAPAARSMPEPVRKSEPAPDPVAPSGTDLFSSSPVAPVPGLFGRFDAEAQTDAQRDAQEPASTQRSEQTPAKASAKAAAQAPNNDASSGHSLRRGNIDPDPDTDVPDTPIDWPSIRSTAAGLPLRPRPSKISGIAKWIAAASVVILASILYVMLSGQGEGVDGDPEAVASAKAGERETEAADDLSSLLPSEGPSIALSDDSGMLGVTGVRGDAEVGGMTDQDRPGASAAAPVASASQPLDRGDEGAGGAQRAEPRPTPARPTPQPTYDVVVYAVNGDLNPVMVWTDVKPATDFYRVPKGEAIRFKAVGTLRIQGQYDDMMVFINGKQVANMRELHYDRSQRMIDIGRSTLREFGNPSTAFVLSLPEGVEPPRSITTAQR